MNILDRSLLLFALLVLSGCGGNVPLNGTVTFSDDGSPLGTGVVCFEAGSFVARGRIQPDGQYRVGSVSMKDGLPPGSYRVYIADAVVETAADPYGGAFTEPLIDGKYNSAETSGLHVEVPNVKRYDINVDRHVSDKKKK